MAVTSDEFRAAFAAYRADAAHGVLDTGRYRMRYFTWGSGGRPVVFVHGMSDAARAFIMVMHRLLPQITGIAYELPDGQTDGSHLARYTHEAYAADLVALLDHLNLPKAAVVGSSFGSTVMLAALAAYPERFTHAVSQNGFAHRPLNRWQRQLARSGRFWPGWFADWPEIYRGVMWKVDRPTLSSLPRDVEQFYLSDGGRTPMRASALRSLTIDRTDFRPALPGIRVPVLVLTSDRDTLVPPECGATLLRLLPDARHVEFTNCGHHPQYSHPGPMADAIAAFLQERGSGK
ncbi:Putative hydrolase or acyltransferase of alpha/beta superfamily OS=Singulisphaera acidiphila (strain ATCC BAA-1392 / DSM 18658 / VKM B-2454 / MOB10) GN=Sinac_1411 PE=4 SV=1: Abhydrolase_6 [Gemmataceae bacterium]|nr:Putative hydrolase or acyltransferase of alpha/beta superfamily OS=Singulisphaera acidiphila (strain ATCC BAA-1392 / DSM 18658 / VKM B-2454 / MOB10) GN=Sinac_1411 PE=4 SV=1: Abhydrolase_6 [Gemmataceae bacterium]VTU00218.1 Putative hydrolase or acyltransferase of alpha/beta superfamily OS=Singulisphaera acidiphila (strain ATCC BAA-1392 / DSM 18658 / VKM B-2454 / MOB10) GN=Sinac_1411 PE=4 SV=1: Abhydrolase_6 [Gemmataceae bacterium]